MDNEKASGGSWWSTLPGLLTATAAVIGSITTLIVTLNQIGAFNRDVTGGTPIPSKVPVTTSTNPPPLPLPSTGTITAGNSATPDGKNWRWTIYLQAPEDTLDKIHHVVYTLHPTYADSVVTVNERGSGPYAFPLTRVAWGTFRVRIHIVMRDGSAKDMSHYLRF